MAIKFGDLIENANTSYALIDLTDNQSRGVAFIDSISTPNSIGVSASIYLGISQDKRRQGMLLVVKDVARVYILEGAPDDGANYTNNYIGTGPSEAGTPWKVVGQLDLQDTDIDVNISDDFNGSEKTFGKYHPNFSQEIGGETYTGIIPVTAWMAEVADGQPAPIASELGATALEIIIDALNEQFNLNPTVTHNLGILPFNEQQVTGTSLSFSCVKANNVNIVSFQYYWRADGQADWTSLGTVNEASINNAGNTATATGISPGTLNIPFDFYALGPNGVQFKVIATDALGATGEAIASSGRYNYHHPIVSNVEATRIYQNSTFANNETDVLRVAGNVDTTISFDVTKNTSENDSTIQNGDHYYSVWVRTKEDSTTYGDWTAVITDQAVVFSGDTASLSYTHNDASAISIRSQEAQWKVTVTDIYSQPGVSPDENILLSNGGTSNTWAYNYFSSDAPGNSNNNSNSLYVRFRFPVFVGTIALTDTTDVSQGVLQAVSEEVEAEIITQMMGADSLSPDQVLTPAIGSAPEYTFPRLYENEFPFASLDTLCAFNNAIAAGYPAGTRFFFAYADNNGPINMDDNANATITDVGSIKFALNEAQQVTAFLQHETGTSSGIDIHGRIANDGSLYNQGSRRLNNIEYQIVIQGSGNAISADIKISD